MNKKENFFLKNIGVIITIITILVSIISGYAVLRYQVSQLEDKVGNQVAPSKVDMDKATADLKESLNKDITYMKASIDRNKADQDKINEVLFKLVERNKVTSSNPIKNTSTAQK